MFQVVFCRHVGIRLSNCHIVGSATRGANYADLQVLADNMITDKGRPSCVVCALPYTDRRRSVPPGQSRLPTLW